MEEPRTNFSTFWHFQGKFEPSGTDWATQLWRNFRQLMHLAFLEATMRYSDRSTILQDHFWKLESYLKTVHSEPTIFNLESSFN